MNYIFIIYGVVIKAFKVWDPMAGNNLYGRNLIFLKVSPIVLQA